LPEAPLRRGQFLFMAGWIKLYRQLKEKPYYKDSEFIHLWVHLLLCANHSQAEFLSGYNIVKLKKGQFITGRKKLSLETGISESKIERILKVFESEQQIEQQTNSRNRLISIVSWDKFQEVEQQKNNKRTASEQQVNTNNNDNNKEEQLTISIYPTFEDFWNLYDHKKDIKKSQQKWNLLTQKEKEEIMNYLPEYIKSTPNKEFRKYPCTFLNNKSWNNEISTNKSDTDTIGTIGHNQLFSFLENN
jgi:hypothetical protein